MENFWAEFTAMLVLHLVGLISPGPNFALVVRNSLLLSRRHAFYTINGATAATIIQLIITVLGLGMLVTQSPALLNIIKISGALFLGYLGLKGLGINFNFFKKTSEDTDSAVAIPEQPVTETPQDSFKVAFMTSLLNPMSLLFYISVFSTTVRPETGLGMRFFYAFIIALTFAGWFLIVALFLSNPHIQEKFNKLKTLIDRVTGSVLILFAIKMLLKDL